MNNTNIKHLCEDCKNKSVEHTHYCKPMGHPIDIYQCRECYQIYWHNTGDDKFNLKKKDIKEKKDYEHSYFKQYEDDMALIERKFDVDGLCNSVRIGIIIK
jgi:hypothetical protein